MKLYRFAISLPTAAVTQNPKNDHRQQQHSKAHPGHNNNKHNTIYTDSLVMWKLFNSNYRKIMEL